MTHINKAISMLNVLELKSCAELLISSDLIPIFEITYNKDLQRNFLFELWGTLIYIGEKKGLTIFLLFIIKHDTY